MMRAPAFYSVGRAVMLAMIGLFVGALMAVFAGESPVQIYRWMWEGAFGTAYDFGLTLYYAAIFVFAGLAVALPLRGGLFNIGGEGQILVGAFAATSLALYLGEDLTHWTAVMLGLGAAFFGGMFWGMIAGWIRAYRGGHEVISSIMLNFVASGLTSWLTIYHFHASDSANPETNAVHGVWLWPRFSWFDDAPVTSFVLIALLASLFFWVVEKYSRLGFEINATRISPAAAEISGIDVKRIRLISMAMGGGVAGLAGGMMVLGNFSRFRIDMSEGFGFVGIPVALLAKGNPVGILLSALLFAFLHHGANALDLEADAVNHDFALIIQAVIVVMVACDFFMPQVLRRFYRRFKGLDVEMKEKRV